MNTFFKTIALLLCFFIISTVMADDLSDGNRFYENRQYIEAFSAYQKGAKKGDLAAQYALANLYAKGIGTHKNEKEAARWYLKAAKRGSIEAQYSLGLLYETGGSDIKQDYIQAAKWYQLAAKLNHAESQVRLGKLYFEGYGISKSPFLSSHWFRKAADLGNAEAMNLLAKQYEEGLGLPQSDELALAWYKKSAEAGNTASIKRLVEVYTEGELDEDDDPEQVKKWQSLLNGNQTNGQAAAPAAKKTVENTAKKEPRPVKK